MKRDPGGKSASAATQAIYFHLLFEDELIELRPILEALGRRRDEVLRRWYQLYHVHFAERRTLSEPEFLQIHGPDIDATSSTLSAGDFDRFVTEVRAVGERLAARGVPFAEVVASMHFFEQAASHVFGVLGAVGPSIYVSFDKLSHCRMIVLAEAYFRSTQAVTAARIYELERDTKALGEVGRRRFRGLVGASAPMRELYERIEAAASTRGTVLVVGESGTGKASPARCTNARRRRTPHRRAQLRRDSPRADRE